MNILTLLKVRLAQIRAEANAELPEGQKLIRVGLVFMLGAVLGILAKYLDGVQVLGEIGTLLGFWVLSATLVAAWSRSPRAAAVHVFVFFIAMLAAYYWYSMILFGFFSRHYFWAWTCVALVSPFLAYAAWYARGSGWIAAIIAALPAALLLVEGYPFFYTLSPARGFDVLAAVFLLIVLSSKSDQKLRSLLVTAAMFILFKQLHVISLVFGWIGA